MSKIKLSKNELKTQKDALKRFSRYLPTLLLKKQQLQIEIRKIDHQIEQAANKFRDLENSIMEWTGLFCEDFPFTQIITISGIVMEKTNIAGVDIPVFKSILIEEKPYDLFYVPLWVDKAVVELKKLLELRALLKTLEIQHSLLGDELRITGQRVNLFEKVKIPQSRENIRKIRIYLGDQQTAQVVCGKISKNKINNG